MSQLSPVLRDVADGGLMFWCPGCNLAHRVMVGDGAGPRWGWNGDADKPVFTPSVLVTGRTFTPAGRAAYEEWYAAGCPPLDGRQFDNAPSVCHTFVGCNGALPGQIVFLGDCTHELAGQTVDLPAWPEREP